MDPTPIVSDTASTSMSAAPADTSSPPPVAGGDTSAPAGVGGGVLDSSAPASAASAASTAAAIASPVTSSSTTSSGSPDLSTGNIKNYTANAQADDAAKAKAQQQKNAQQVGSAIKNIMTPQSRASSPPAQQISASYNAMFGVAASGASRAPSASAPAAIQSNAAPIQFQSPQSQAPGAIPMQQPLQLSAMSDMRLKQNILKANPQVNQLLEAVYKNVIAKRKS